MRAAVPKIAGLFRQALARKKVAQLRLAKLETERTRQIVQFCQKHKDKALLNDAAAKIQVTFMAKIRQQKEMRELRQKLKSMPYVVRATFVKMHFLKANTRALTSNLGIKLGTTAFVGNNLFK